MEFKFDSIGSISKEDLSAKAKEITASQLNILNEHDALRLALSCIDLTSLDGNDNVQVVQKLCEKALSFKDESKEIPSVAAVCVYSNFVPIANKVLGGSGIQVACVAGGFPSGQGLPGSRVYDVLLAAEAGADEIDIVFPRGLLFAGEFTKAFDEVSQMRQACKGLKFKVILESGELTSPLDLCRAAEISINAGADFIKTSTGKTSTGSTPEALWIMLQVIHEQYKLTGKRIGLKPSGGIGDPESAIDCIKLTASVLGSDWLNNTLFRIGASRLADKIFQKLS